VLRAGRSGFDSREEQNIFFYYFTAPRPALGPTQPPIQWVPGVKRQGREADGSPPPCAQVKNGGAIPALTHTSSWRRA
jgi:hypothetical protein